MSEKLSELSEMSDCAAASGLMRELAPAGSAKARIGVALVRINKLKHIKRKWSWSRAKDIWYGDARRIDAHEMDALRAAVRKREIEEARSEYRELDERLRRVEAALAVAYQDLDSATFDEVRKGIVGPGLVDRPGTERND